MRRTTLEVDGPPARYEAVDVDFDQRAHDNLRIAAQRRGARVAFRLLLVSLAAAPDHCAEKRGEPQPRYQKRERRRDSRDDQRREHRDDDQRSVERLKPPDFSRTVLFDVRKLMRVDCRDFVGVEQLHERVPKSDRRMLDARKRERVHKPRSSSANSVDARRSDSGARDDGIDAREQLVADSGVASMFIHSHRRGYQLSRAMRIGMSSSENRRKRGSSARTISGVIKRRSQNPSPPTMDFALRQRCCAGVRRSPSLERGEADSCRRSSTP